MPGRKKLAAVMTAVSITAAGGGIGAAGAQAQDEVLQATATAFNAGGLGMCLRGSAWATFSDAGSATGPYHGTFTETNATISVDRATLAPSTLTMSIPFTVSSGNTAITGTITNPLRSGGSILCFGGSFLSAGPVAKTNSAAYTATIESQGQPAQTVSGTAQASAAFRFRPYWATQATPPTVTLLNLPSP
jgi:hypothetical protein